jgi:hypothetical protein
MKKPQLEPVNEKLTDNRRIQHETQYIESIDRWHCIGFCRK